MKLEQAVRDMTLMLDVVGSLTWTPERPAGLRGLSDEDVSEVRAAHGRLWDLVEWLTGEVTQ